jgi:TRAP-type uncharacterized transport system substrate-binding protein
MAENKVRSIASIRPMARFVGVSLRDLMVTSAPIILITLVAIWAAYWFVRPAPPDTITITSGPPGSTFLLTAEKYRKVLARDGVKLKVLPSAGSLDNLTRLNDPKFRVDVGFVQGGVTGGVNLDRLVSLGSVFHVPLLLFYRSTDPANFIADFSGKRIAIGPQGSGTHVLALALLKANAIEPGGATTLLDIGGEEASQAVLTGSADAVFLMGDSATPPVMRKLLTTPGIRLFDFTQADAYSRRYSYLEKLNLPMGVVDFGKNVPPQDVHLIGPTAELVARSGLHPALSDMLIAAAREVHGKATVMQRAGEFPAPLEHDFRISSDAKRFYSSGNKSFFYRYLPFWLASLADRMMVVVVPIVVLLIPGLKLVPALYSWRIRSRIYRWYGTLIALERSVIANPAPEERANLLKRIDDIESEVNKMKMPLAYAEQFYVLRDHIKFVGDRYRQRMAGSETQTSV